MSTDPADVQPAADSPGSWRRLADRLRARVADTVATPVRVATDTSDQLRAILSQRTAPGANEPRGGAYAGEYGRMFLAFQPEVDLRTGRIVAVEALVRWRHPDLGDINPDSFITIAEEAGLIAPLGAWVLDESLRVFATWTDAMPDLDIVVRVNVSPTQLADPGLVALVEATLDRYQLAGDRLCVEITENFQVQDTPAVVATVLALRQRGVTSALDDLAAGFSSLGRLRALPIDAVKIDRTLVTGIDGDEKARLIVRAVVGLAGSLGIDVVAEGVESAGEAATLLDLGCVRAQGHRFGRPVDDAQMAQLLARKARGRPAERGARPRPVSD